MSENNIRTRYSSHHIYSPLCPLKNLLTWRLKMHYIDKAEMKRINNRKIMRTQIMRRSWREKERRTVLWQIGRMLILKGQVSQGEFE